MKRILQPLADSLIKRLEQAENKEEFDQIYNLAFYIDYYLTEWGIYLD